MAFIISCVVICSSFNLRVVGVLAMTYHVTDELCTVTVRTMVGVRVYAVWKNEVLLYMSTKSKEYESTSYITN